MSTTGFLFWNVGERPLGARLFRLIQAHAVECVILAEPGAWPLSALTTFNVVNETVGRLGVYSCLPDTRWQLLLDGGRWRIFAVQHATAPELLLAVAHLQSKLEATELDQLNAALSFAADIRIAETQRGHSRTVIVGDLNMNPFEPGISMNRGLHGTSTRAVARRGSRTVQRVEYPFFYNPMWSFFGDRPSGPAGTYYRAASHAVNYHWNIYDQVLLRPALMDGLEDVRILDHDGQESLLTVNGLPDATNGSDHLPLYFRLNWDNIRS